MKKGTRTQVTLAMPNKGVDNLTGEVALGKNTVRTALNVDLDVDNYSRRQGTARVVSGSFHSLWYAAQKDLLLVCKDGVLNSVNPETYALSSLITVGDAPLSYTEYNGNVYFTNRHFIGWIPSDSTVARYLGVPVPNAPLIAPHTSGTLTPGTYGVVVTWVDDRGEESGASDVAQVSLSSSGGIQLSGLVVDSALIYRVYLTAPDGEGFYKAAEFVAAYSTYVVGSFPKGASLGTQHLAPLRPGTIIRWYNGRLYTAINDKVFCSRPLQPHLTDPSVDIWPMSGYISFIEPVTTGLYVGDSRGVWFLEGHDPMSFKQRLVTTVRAFPSSSCQVPGDYFDRDLTKTRDQRFAVWLSPDGYVAGLSTGELIPLQADRLRVPMATGRSTLLLRDGTQHVITLTNLATVVPVQVAQDSIV